MTNVQSVRLVSYAFPNNCFNISTSYQNTKLAYNYHRDFVFDTRSLDVKPQRSLDNVDSFTIGQGRGDYRLGAFQQVLEQVFPGIIKTYYSPTIGGSPGINGHQPDNGYFTTIATAAGETQRNLILGPKTLAKDIVIVSIAPFEAQYAMLLPEPVNAEIEDTLITTES